MSGLRLTLFYVLTCLLQHAHGSEIIHGKKAPKKLMQYMVSVQDSRDQHVCGGFLISEDFVLTAAHCDQGVALGTKIIKGKKPRRNTMKYMAYLQNGNGTHICGGFLISEDYVMTAAHCEDMNPVSIILGTHSLQNIDKTMSYGITKCKHPSYNANEFLNDIMLLKLSRKAHDGKKGQIKPVQLLKQPANLKSKKKCKVAGWGSTGPGELRVNELRVATVPIIDQKTCLKKWEKKLPPKVICAGGYKTKKGFCGGESGGPLVCNKVAVGVVSFYNSMNFCDYPNVPNVYTDIFKFLPWINDILEKNKC